MTTDTQVFESKGARTEIGATGLTLDWDFWDPQLEVLSAIDSGDFDVVCYRGGYGSGKTILGARWVHEVGMTVPKSDNLVIAPDSAKGGPTTYKVFFEELPGEDTVPDEGGDPENSPIVADYNRNDRRLTYVTGAVARLGSADVWNRYAGGEFNAIWCDEVAHYEHTDIYQLNEMLLSRQRTEAGPNVTLWTSTGNGYNDFHKFTEKRQLPDGSPLPTRLYVVVADSRDNPFLPERDKLTRQFAGTEREEEALAGGFAAAEGLVYPRFSRERHVITEAEADELVHGNWRIFGYDHGWDDPRVVLEIGQTAHDQLVAIDCFYQSETQVEEAVRWLVENDKPSGTVYAEHEPSHYQKFRSAGYRVEAAEKDLDEGIPAVRSLLELDSEDRPGLLVSERCGELINEFHSYKEDHVGKAKATDHGLDSARYAVMGHVGPTDGYSGTGTWGG
ncbi:hypothetical protein [Halomarina litorea]|uniref:hypothetical protein n=1 Tax=Halomarina litorea TaxID=2961595 RepID=UPI0020C2700A|nr:hypothetical protein [Halomarina sp. BCD28]